MDSQLDTSADPPVDVDLPESRWTAWAIWSGITFAMALLAVFGAGFDTGLLLGWVVGVIVAAMLMVFGR